MQSHQLHVLVIGRRLVVRVSWGVSVEIRVQGCRAVGTWTQVSWTQGSWTQGSGAVGSWAQDLGAEPLGAADHTLPAAGRVETAAVAPQLYVSA